MPMLGVQKAVNPDAFFVRCAHYKCAGYGWHPQRNECPLLDVRSLFRI